MIIQPLPGRAQGLQETATPVDLTAGKRRIRVPVFLIM